MTLSEKIGILRQLEGNLRGLGRPLTKSELVRLLAEEQGNTISLAYLSQLESGKRTHMTAKSRELLARFFKVHPGYLVGDPEGYRTELTTLTEENRIDDLLKGAAAGFETEDPDLAAALRCLARHPATRELILLVAELCSDPALMHRLKSQMASLRQADRNRPAKAAGAAKAAAPEKKRRRSK